MTATINSFLVVGENSMNRGEIKKDIELGKYIKPNGKKGDYRVEIIYSDNGDKLH
jgi:hypothetical protein